MVSPPGRSPVGRSRSCLTGEQMSLKLGPRLAVAVALTVVLGAWFFGLASATHAARSSSSVLLDSGVLAKNWEWTVRTSRPRGSNSAQRPCISVELNPIHPSSPIEFSEGESSCRRPLVDYPNILAIVDEFNKPTRTVVGMAFSTDAYSVSLYFSGSIKDRTIPLHLLSEGQAKRAHLDAFRYGAIAFTGQSCIDRFIVRSKSGAVLDDGGRMRCRVHR